MVKVKVKVTIIIALLAMSIMESKAQFLYTYCIRSNCHPPLLSLFNDLKMNERLIRFDYRFLVYVSRMCYYHMDSVKLPANYSKVALQGESPR